MGGPKIRDAAGLVPREEASRRGREAAWRYTPTHCGSFPSKPRTPIPPFTLAETIHPNKLYWSITIKGEPRDEYST